MSEKILEMAIEELNLSLRAYTCLKRAGYDTVEQLCNITIDELKTIRNMGNKPAQEIVQALQARGLNLKDCDAIISVATPEEESEAKKRKFTFRFARGTIEVFAFDVEEAKTVAKSEAIKRGWYYGVLKHKVVRLDELINLGNFTPEEEIQFRQLLSKARQGNMYEEAESNS